MKNMIAISHGLRECAQNADPPTEHLTLREGVREFAWPPTVSTTTSAPRVLVCRCGGIIEDGVAPSARPSFSGGGVRWWRCTSRPSPAAAIAISPIAG
jgi:hypothetical protein